MRMRTLLTAASALVATTALTLVPAAQADSPTGDDIAYLAVGGSTADVDYDAAMALKGLASVSWEVAGVLTESMCWGGSADAIVHSGPYTTGPAINFTSLTMTCGWFYPGVVPVLSVPSNGCARFDAADSNVHDSFPTGTVDTGEKTEKVSRVDGMFVLPANCVVTVSAGICTIEIGGSTPAQFDEAIKDDSPVTQDFRLKGNGLTITNVSPLCFGAVSVNDTLQINNVNFNAVVTNETVSGDPATGPIDFRLTAQP